MLMSFDPQNPFPLPVEGQHTYADAQAHSQICDSWLGLHTNEVEEALIDKALLLGAGSREHQLWIGLPVRSLLTPYSEIRELLERLRPRQGQTVIDCGAGYGRIAFVLERHFPGVRFIGYELVPERVQEAARCLGRGEYPNAEMRCVDLADPAFMPAAADFYFIYDFGTRGAIEKTLQDLKRTARHRAATVVGRGRAVRDAIERGHPWLSQVVAPEHFSHYSIYRSA